MAPNAPDEAGWSARIAICGLQLVAEQEFDRRDHGERSEGFEQEREDDAERCENAIRDAASRLAITIRSTWCGLGIGARPG
jgi:hypothetical protein